MAELLVQTSFNIESFDPRTMEYRKWFQRLERAFTVFEVWEEVRVSYLLRYIGSKSFEILCDEVLPEDPYKKTLQGYAASLQNSYITSDGYFEVFHSMKMLPPLFEVDDYKSCLQNGNLYCKMMAELQSTAMIANSTLEDNQKFRRNVLSRALCIPEQNAYNEASIKDYSQKLINGRIESLNLTSSISSLACTDGNISRTSFDYFMLMMVISYGCLVSYATIQHYRHRNSPKGDGLLRNFSIWYNWKKKTRLILNEDYEKLKSVQGLRFYVNMSVLLVHTLLSYSFGFIKNTAQIEQVMTNPLLVAISTFAVFLVQICFSISSWLSTLQICLIFQRHGEFSFKHASSLIINRYFRLAVMLFVLVAFYNTTWINYYQGPENFDFVLTYQTACQKNWHATLFLFNNFYFLEDMLADDPSFAQLSTSQLVRLSHGGLIERIHKSLEMATFNPILLLELSSQ
ncbi:hypothetical protein JTB14_017145 [Gonioctena quinquepunctata]|nr:hypothetical protein JTB14_017145 [Gonioctena quinquepunctata]